MIDGPAVPKTDAQKEESRKKYIVGMPRVADAGYNCGVNSAYGIYYENPYIFNTNYWYFWKACFNIGLIAGNKARARGEGKEAAFTEWQPFFDAPPTQVHQPKLAGALPQVVMPAAPGDQPKIQPTAVKPAPPALTLAALETRVAALEARFGATIPAPAQPVKGVQPFFQPRLLPEKEPSTFVASPTEYPKTEAVEIRTEDVVDPRPARPLPDLDTTVNKAVIQETAPAEVRPKGWIDPLVIDPQKPKPKGKKKIAK